MMILSLKQHGRLDDQSTGQGDTLLLATGKLVGHAAFHAGKLHQLKDLRHFFLDHLVGELAQFQAIGDVVENIVMGKQRITLEDHGGIAFVGRQAVDWIVTKIDFARVRALETGNHA